MERSDQRTLTLDDSAVASNQGNVNISFWRWAKRYPLWPALLIGSSLASLALIFLVSKMFLIAVPLALLANYFYWHRVREHFLYGDANPGVVVSTAPLLIAVRTDMTKGEGEYPMVRILQERPCDAWGSAPAAGTRVATIGLYAEGDEERAPHWGRFEPRPVEPVAKSPDDARRLLESFAPEQWERLERALEDLPTMREGLHRVEVEDSSWGVQKAALR